MLPTGTNNDINIDEPNSFDARRNHKVVPSYNGLWRKEPPTFETVILADGSTERRPTLGAAISSAGLKDTIEEFVEIDLFTLTPQEVLDVTAFVHQVDSGLAPAVHRAWRLDAQNRAELEHELRGFLMPQASARNCDVAVFGTLDSGAGHAAMRWYWERQSNRFLAEDSQVAAMSLDELLEQVDQDLARVVFLGLPVGMAERFAVDYDEDQLFNADELALGTGVYVADTDGDGEPDGHETAHGGDPLDGTVGGQDHQAPMIRNLRLVYVTTRVAKILYETDEPTQSETSWAGGPKSGVVRGTRFEKVHSVLLRELTPNTSHGVSVTAIDLAGNRRSAAVPGVQTANVIFPNDVVFENASVTVLQDSGGTLQFDLTGTARRKNGSTANGFRLRVDVFVNDVKTQSVVQGTASGSNGITTVTVTQNGLTPGDVVTANVESLWTNFAGSRLAA
jgi:hypothetical protein